MARVRRRICWVLTVKEVLTCRAAILRLPNSALCKSRHDVTEALAAARPRFWRAQRVLVYLLWPCSAPSCCPQCALKLGTPASVDTHNQILKLLFFSTHLLRSFTTLSPAHPSIGTASLLSLLTHALYPLTSPPAVPHDEGSPACRSPRRRHLCRQSTRCPRW
jgi:hypothetical protein